MKKLFHVGALVLGIGLLLFVTLTIKNVPILAIAPLLLAILLAYVGAGVILGKYPV